MARAEIDLTVLKKALNAVLEHLIEDLGIEKVAIDETEDCYWDCSAPEMFDMSTKPSLEEVGQLSDDLGFVRLIRRGQGADVSYNLIHLAPLLRYIGEKVKR